MVEDRRPTGAPTDGDDEQTTSAPKMLILRVWPTPFRFLPDRSFQR